MARVHEVKKARKAIPSAGIAVGDSYYWWKFRTGGRGGTRQVSKTYPKRSQTTQSDFYAQVFDLEDRIGALSADAYETPEDLKSELDDIADEIRSLGEEQNDKYSNMPEGLQQGDTGQLLEERRDACEEWADEIENINVDEVDPEAVEAALKAEQEKGVTPTDEEIGEAVLEAIKEACQEAIDEAQGAQVPG